MNLVSSKEEKKISNREEGRKDRKGEARKKGKRVGKDKGLGWGGGRRKQNPSETKLSESCGKFSSVQLLNHVQLFATLWTTALQAPLSMETLQARME